MKKRMTAASPKIKTLEADAGYNLSVHSVMVVRKIYVRRVSTDEESNNGRDNQTRITESSGTASRMFNARTKKITPTMTKQWNQARLPKNVSRCHRKSPKTCDIEISPKTKATYCLCR